MTLSILAEVLPARQATRQGERAIERRILQEIAERPAEEPVSPRRLPEAEAHLLAALAAWRDHPQLRDPLTISLLARLVQWRRDRSLALGDRRGYAYKSIAEYVLQHGAFFEPQPLPADVAYRGIGRCYRKSAELASAAPDRFRYCEGYVVTPLFDGCPFLHGWCIDDRGRVVDCSWGDLGQAYMGLTFDLNIVRGRRRRRVPILDDWANDWPILRA